MMLKEDYDGQHVFCQDCVEGQHRFLKGLTKRMQQIRQFLADQSLADDLCLEVGRRVMRLDCNDHILIYFVMTVG